MAEENVDKKSAVILLEESPVRAVVCVRKKEDTKRFEETEDCFILGFDPYESIELCKLSLDETNNHRNDDDAAEISVVAEKGQVACRDYPHSRHLCIKFPFTTTPHQSYCDMCYCYVCDSAAPCKYWTQLAVPHCDADSSASWKERRKMKKEFDIIIGH
uniref:Uncharacterized protein n=1 Tax=Lotus japonicus TaxID=34305 RepID=I3SDF5_LOTJA|nr:unknown [Lotus japonicus]AFK45384.1 unknown [Lotus japonicus]